MIQQSALETAVLEHLHHLYRAQGFPPAASVRVLRRENTGGGRYVDLECDKTVRIEDGYIDLGGSYIEMEGIPHGMMAVALIKNGYLTMLEFTVYGGHQWSGDERGWKIV